MGKGLRARAAWAAWATCAICIAGALSCTPRRPEPVKAEYALPSPQGKALDTADPPGLVPSVGKWMVAPNGGVASWMDQRSAGKLVYEPINVAIFDPFAESRDEAEARLVAACAAAGFEARSGHSSGYGGIIGGYVYPELPTGPGDAFSDGPFILPNNHGRIFGPHGMRGGWLFIGAFSREGIDLAAPVPHVYESMNRARDTFVSGMTRRAGYELQDFAQLENALLKDPAAWTGDHDGAVPLIVATK